MVKIIDKVEKNVEMNMKQVKEN